MIFQTSPSLSIKAVESKAEIFVCGRLLILSCLIFFPLSCSSPSLSFHTSSLKRKGLFLRSSCQDLAWLSHLLHLPPVLPPTPSHLPPQIFTREKNLQIFTPCDSSAPRLRFVCSLSSPRGFLGCSPFPSNPSHMGSPSHNHFSFL